MKAGENSSLPRRLLTFLASPSLCAPVYKQLVETLAYKCRDVKGKVLGFIARAQIRFSVSRHYKKNKSRV